MVGPGRGHQFSPVFVREEALTHTHTDTRLSKSAASSSSSCASECIFDFDTFFGVNHARASKRESGIAVRPRGKSEEAEVRVEIVGPLGPHCPHTHTKARTRRLRLLPNRGEDIAHETVGASAFAANGSLSGDGVKFRLRQGRYGFCVWCENSRGKNIIRKVCSKQIQKSVVSFPGFLGLATTRKYAKYTLAVRPLGFPHHHPSSEVEKRWCVCKETVSSLGGKVLRW